MERYITRTISTFLYNAKAFNVDPNGEPMVHNLEDIHSSTKVDPKKIKKDLERTLSMPVWVSEAIETKQTYRMTLSDFIKNAEVVEDED